MKTDQVEFAPLFWRSLLAGVIAVAVVFPFHYLMRKVALFYSFDHFVSWDSALLFLLILFLLGHLQLSAILLLRDRNESSEVLSTFIGIGLHVEYVKDIVIIFLCCLCSFAAGLALGAEAPSVFMTSLVFGAVFSKLYKSSAMSKEGVRIGGAIGFSLAFHNPLAGLANSFAFAFFRQRRKGEWRVVVSSCLTVILTHLLYSGFRYLAYREDFGLEWWRCFVFHDYRLSLQQFGFASLAHVYWMAFLPLITLPLSYIYVKLGSLARKTLWQDNGVSYRLSLFCGVAICFALAFFMPEALGTGAAYFELSESLLDYSIAALFLLLLLRFAFTLFSFSSHFSGGNIIPSLGFGALFAAFLLRLSPFLAEGYETLFVYAFALSFFGFLTGNGLLPLALVFSFGLSPALFVLLLPSSIAAILLSSRVGGFSTLSRALSMADSRHHAFATSRFRLYPFSDIADKAKLITRSYHVQPKV